MRHPVRALLALVGLALGPAAYAQPTWNTVMMEPTVSLQDICVLGDGMHGWAVGSLSYGGESISSVLRTTDGGQRWTRLPFAYETSAILNGVAFVSPTRGWIVGAAGRIYATTDGGASWTPQSSGTSRKLSKACFLDAQRGWVTGGWQDGSSFLVLRTTNGGTSWENRSFGSGAFSCEDVFFADPLNGWIVGQDSAIHPHIHHTTDGGLTWARQTVPTGTGSPGGVEFVSATEGWVCTSSIYEVPPGAILHTTNGGTNWAIQGYTNLHYSYCIDARDPLNLVIPSTQVLSPTAERVLVSHDGGANWSQSTPPLIAYTWGTQYVGQDIWFCSDYGQILRSRDEGATWDWDFRAPYWKSIDWSDVNTGWLVAGSSVGVDGYCFRTFDAGATWSRDRKAPGGSRVTFVDADHGWMLWEGTGASVWRTTDAGASWSRSFIGGAWIDGIVFASTSRGWAHGSSGTMRATTDGGATWSSQSLGTSAYVDACFFLNANEGWCGGGYGGGDGFIRHTTNGGANWTAQTPATSGHFTSLFFLDALNGWALAYGSEIQRTTNGGATWNWVASVPPYYAYEILMRDPLHGWILVGNAFTSDPGNNGRGFIYETSDGGSTWTQTWSSPYPMGHLYDIALRDGSDPWVCGHNMTLLHVVDPASAPVLAGREGDWFVTPNPFVSEARIVYNLPSAGPVQFSVFDARGRVVTRVSRGAEAAGRHEMVWKGDDLSGNRLARGVYFGRLEAAGATPGVVKIVR